MRILAHRALLQGPDASVENTLPALAAACAEQFDVEFDVNVDAEGRLVLSHDPCPWSVDRDAATFLRRTRPQFAHALNVKDLDTLDELLAAVGAAGAADRFVLFDFELLDAPRQLLAEVQRRGYRVAHRISEHEPYTAEYAADASVTMIWLDELEGPWVDAAVVRQLRNAGKDVLYVSPDLHRRAGGEELERRWRELAAWDVSGICTDYPLKLRDLLPNAA
jgi:glycerophosphoryl diester phosphodiesterase